MRYYIHPTSLVKTKNIGAGTNVWAFCNILENATIGKNCNICDHVFIENDVVIGDRVTIKCGVWVWDGITVEDDVFIGPSATFTNDDLPRSKQHQKQVLRTRIEEGASIGANATILPGITIGRNSMVGAGSVVTYSVPANAIVVGNPATIISYVDSHKLSHAKENIHESKITRSLIPGVRVYTLEIHTDMRGSLIAGEFSSNKDLPFIPKRYFVLFDIPTKKVRGEHAHKKSEQFLICINGSVSIMVDDGKKRAEIILDKKNKGLYIPPKIWASQYNFSENAVLLCLASDKYDSSDYIRDYNSYLKYVLSHHTRT